MTEVDCLFRHYYPDYVGQVVRISLILEIWQPIEIAVLLLMEISRGKFWESPDEGPFESPG